MAPPDGEPTVLQLWLGARSRGWSLEEFCAAVAQGTRVYKHVEPAQARFVAYCSHSFELGALERLAPRFAAPPPRRQTLQPLLPADVSPLIAPPIDRVATLGAGQSGSADLLSLSPPRQASLRPGGSSPRIQLRSPASGGDGRASPSPSASPPGGGAEYQQLDEAGAPLPPKPQSLWPLAVFFSLVVIAGLFLTVLTYYVHKEGLSSGMATLFPICALAFFLALGVLVRARVSYCRRFFLPSCVIGGCLGLVFLQIAHLAVKRADNAREDAHKAVGDLADAWATVPGVAINVVFATLFLGREVPPIRQVWYACSTQLVYGQLLAWTQYVVGLSVGAVFGGLLFHPHKQEFGVVLPIGFEGGHGTAAGMQQMFEEIGWREGHDFCVASATVGLLAGLFVGILLVNWYRRYKAPAPYPGVGAVELLRGHTALTRDEHGDLAIDDAGQEAGASERERHDMLRAKETERKRRKELMRMTFVPRERQESAGMEIVQPVSLDNLAYHITVVLLAVSFAYGAKAILITLDRPMEVLVGVERVFSAFPTFPMSMLGGIIMQLLMQRSGHTDKVDTKTLGRISATALDFLVVAAIATVKLNAVAEGIGAFSMLMACGVLLHVCFIVVIAPRFFSEEEAWFERGITELGQSMGVTATGAQRGGSAAVCCYCVS
eukprot:TRINITY_DN35098_c0_g1_i1.p1 TRINITY_DN35098_c0_g1~~TRINITY_DN35098_c0_g1_i1.p1  ORF type:complete len:691 (+),score=209.07 TRINITY_DN35098_c0_g1_i1:86-2074(+)